MTPSELAIWETIQAMNLCWTCGDSSELARLNEYFHDSMVAITQTDKLRLEGKQACFDGWTNFSRNANITAWKEIDPKIEIYGDTAVVTYYFQISFEMGGQKLDQAGRDMLVLIKENEKWIVVADQFSPFPTP
jgi:hypothetical protein